MMAAPTLAQLLVQETKEQIYQRALDVAVSVGLPVTTWSEGDPTRSLYHVLSETLYALEAVAVRYVASGFLDLAAALDDTQWLVLTAYEQYGYTAREATYATATVRLTNTGAGVYAPDALDLVFAKTTDADVTYRNTTGGTLGAGGTLDVTVECETAGTDGSAAIGEIELVTSLAGVTASNTTAAVGTDAESASSIVEGCRAKLEALSPNGAAGAYVYVALNQDLTGAAAVTRARVLDDSDTGEVTLYLASASGGASAPDVALVEAAILTYATPLCVTPDVKAAAALPVTITASVLAYDTIGESVAAVEAKIEDAITSMLADVPIGGEGTAGKLYRAQIIDAIVQAYPGYIYGVTLTSPAAAVDLTFTSTTGGVATYDGASVISVTLETV
jgi:hypothetical protein